MPVDDDTRSKLLGIWEALGRPEPPDLPDEALISEGISQDDYNEWRLDLEDEKRRERETLADAKLAEARDADLRARGMEPMPPRRTPRGGQGDRAGPTGKGRARAPASGGRRR